MRTIGRVFEIFGQELWFILRKRCRTRFNVAAADVKRSVTTTHLCRDHIFRSVSPRLEETTAEERMCVCHWHVRVCACVCVHVCVCDAGRKAKCRNLSTTQDNRTRNILIKLKLEDTCPPPLKYNAKSPDSPFTFPLPIACSPPRSSLNMDECYFPCRKSQRAQESRKGNATSHLLGRKEGRAQDGGAVRADPSGCGRQKLLIPATFQSSRRSL